MRAPWKSKSGPSSKRLPDVEPPATRRNKVRTIAAIGLAVTLLATPAFAESAPQSLSVTTWYKQDVYDRAKNDVGDVRDVLITPEGKATALVIGVGGFLSIGEKDVIVPFTDVKQTMQDGKPYLTIDTTKEAMKSAPGYKYDSKTMMWIPADAK